MAVEKKQWTVDSVSIWIPSRILVSSWIPFGYETELKTGQVNFWRLDLNEAKDSELRILISNLFHWKMEERKNNFLKYYISLFATLRHLHVF